MAAPPAKTAISDTYPNPSNATARAGFAALYDYVTSFAFGQCRLVKSGSNLVLQRYNGLWLTINGTVQAIPSAGVSLAPTGLSSGTLYYIYAYMSGLTMMLEASTTGHSMDTSTGVEVKTGDATRTLVGMARPTAGPAWQDSNSQRFVLSWFNRRPINCGPTVLSASSGNSGLGFTEITTSLRIEFLSWGSDSCRFSFEGALSNNVANSVSTTALALSGTVSESYSAGQVYQAGAFVPFSCSLVTQAMAEGYYYVTPFALQNAVSTATYAGGGGLPRCVHTGIIQG